MPTAQQPMRPAHTMSYEVRETRAGFEATEQGDHLAVVATADDARDAVYVRAHRRAFEFSSLSGWVRIHGALVDVAGRRVLFAGASGVGKTILALRMLVDGDAVQGDESVLVRGGVVMAVPRPLHLKPDADRLVPEIAALLGGLPRVADVAVLDPARCGFGWSLREVPLDQVILLDRAPGPPGCVPVAQTEVIAALVPEVFPLAETKSTLLREVTAAVSPARCHRLATSDPAAMRAAVLDALDQVG